MPPEKRNLFYRGFNRVYEKAENAYTRLIGRMVGRSGLMVLIGLVLSGIGVWGIARLPTAFIPNEDQGYLMIAAQLPDGAALGRTTGAMDWATKVAHDTPGVEHVIAISGMSALDNFADLPNAGVAFVVLKPWDERGKKTHTDILSIAEHLQAALETAPDGKLFVVPPPPIQGIGNAGGLQMQLELLGGSFDYAKLNEVTRQLLQKAAADPQLQRVLTTFSPGAPHVTVTVDRARSQTLRVSVGDVFSALSSYLGSTFVNQFNKFGLSLQVYTQAESKFRQRPDDLLNFYVRSQRQPDGAARRGRQSGVRGRAVAHHPLQSLSVGDDHRRPGARHQFRPGYDRHGRHREKYVAGRCRLSVDGDVVSGKADREPALLPVRTVGAAGLSLPCRPVRKLDLAACGALGGAAGVAGPVVALTSLGVANNLYTQIGLILMIALSAKNGILIVEMAREGRMVHGKPILEAAVDASRLRFRPILMTSFAFGLGVVPLVLATGAGAVSRISLGLSVLSGIIASTCLAVLFVPSFFVVLQKFDEYRAGRKAQGRFRCQGGRVITRESSARPFGIRAAASARGETQVLST